MILRVFRHHSEPLSRNLPGCARSKQSERAAYARAFAAITDQQENSMNRKMMILAGLAAVTLTASAAPAGAQGFGVGVGFGDYGYGGWNGGYGYRPGVGVSVGFGTPGWGYDDWSYGSYAAAPCTCGT